MINAIASMCARRGARVGRRPPPPPRKYNKYFWALLVAFLLLFFIWGPFCYVFLILGAFSPCGGLFATFYFMVESFFFWSAPHPAKISAGAHDCKEGSRACYPEFFLCDRNLVSSGHVWLRFCLKNDKNNDKL